MKKVIFGMEIVAVMILSGCSGKEVSTTAAPASIPDYSGFGSDPGAGGFFTDSTCLAVLYQPLDSMVRTAGSGFAGNALSLTENSCHRVVFATQYPGQTYTLVYSNEGENPCYMTTTVTTSLGSVEVANEYLCELHLPADAFEPDSQLSQAKAITVGGGSQARTIILNDEDWIYFSADSGQTYTITTTNSGLLDIRLFDVDEQSVPGSLYERNNDSIVFNPGASGAYYIRIRPKGQAVSYSISLSI
jgi:hypothetical protein